MALTGSEEQSDGPTKPSLKRLQTDCFGNLDKQQLKVLQNIGKPHVESFNYMIDEGLSRSILDMPPVEFLLNKKTKVALQIKDVNLANPMVHKDAAGVTDYKMYPAECRSRGATYKGKLNITLNWSINEEPQPWVERTVGEIPIMVKSKRCNLYNLNPKELVRKGEEAEEFGGYFIINGNERIIRMLIMQRRNYPIAMARPSWKNRGKLFSEYGVSIRCVKNDQSGTNMVLHYLTNGTVQVMISYLRELFFLPVVMILKGLCDVTDYYIYQQLSAGKEHDSFYTGCITSMLRDVQNAGLLTQKYVKIFIGERFRTKLNLPPWYTEEEVADFLFRRCVCTHLDSNVAKFHLIVFMVKKLFAVAKGECAVENPDSLMNQEVLLGGHIYLNLIKDKLESWLSLLKTVILKKAERSPSYKLTPSALNMAMNSTGEITRAVNYFLATGNLVTRSGLNMQQFSGFTVVAEKLNFSRYVSHFRCVHRGAFFSQMRTTAVRKLLPESWGFLCPVHTPDGAPCGLLNHMTALAEVINFQLPVGRLPKVLISLGMKSVSSVEAAIGSAYVAILDGKVLGWVEDSLAEEFVSKLRYLKATGNEKVPYTLEIGFVPKTGKASQYPGIFLFSTPARLLRPVFNLHTKTVEWIGSFEQVYMNICVVPEESYESITTHQELKETSILSIVASMIPYPDFNQSPRNMYQCQMGKQTMGTPCHTYRHRSDNKMYRIQTPQAPFVKTISHDSYRMDDYPSGTNAVVAVISYTGYDMEDAMILNKASVERGFKHGSIYKSEFINLRELAGCQGKQICYVFGRKSTDKHLVNKIDSDGLPYIGVSLEYGDPICSYIDVTSGETKYEKYKSTEKAYVLDVKLCGNDMGSDILQKICVTFWIQRNPSIGDKFASRAGQKGVCSQLWPVENMPFTESGMTPDIIFNPHGFPSRMTIGMMIETMAGKSAALHGCVHDATPFKFSEDNPASAYFGEILQKAGYNYYGTERMYSGVDGRELEADIFFGIVYYQRLRHMVADKYQVRTTGPIDMLTHQPIKGRKRAGGIRFGEMERDSLLSHGTSFMLHDRLYNCSDKSLAYVCKSCQSILSPIFQKLPREECRRWTCSTCQSDETVVISLPYVYRYLTAELAAVNIKVNLELT